MWVSLPSGVWEDVSEFSGVLGDSVGPGDGLSADATAGPEPSLVLAGDEAHELLSNGRVVEGDGPHATSSANSGSLKEYLNFELFQLNRDWRKIQTWSLMYHMKPSMKRVHMHLFWHLIYHHNSWIHNKERFKSW